MSITQLEFFGFKAQEILEAGPKVLIVADLGIGARPIMALAARNLVVNVISPTRLHSEWKKEESQFHEMMYLTTIHRVARYGIEAQYGEVLIVELTEYSSKILKVLTDEMKHFKRVWVRGLMPVDQQFMQFVKDQQLKIVTIKLGEFYNDQLSHHWVPDLLGG